MASPLTSDLLKHFAMEAESVCDYDLAERYYKEVCMCVCNMFVGVVMSCGMT